MNEQNKDVRKNSQQNETSTKADLGILDTGVELKRALEAWNELAAQAPAQSADEKLLQDVQNLLKQLKSKIEEFK